MFDFPEGVVVFFRVMTADGNLARSVHLRGRQLLVNSSYSHTDDYVVADEEGRPLGYYPREFVSAILPLEITGPGATDAGNTSQATRN